MLIPPPLIAAGFAAAMWGVAEWTGAGGFAGQALIAGAVAFTGFAIDVSALIAFRRDRTTVNPMKPEATSALVTSGPYRFSRNPMYLGLTLILTAWALWLGNPWNAILIALFVAIVTRWQIMPEERAIAAKFGADFDDYRSRVRRWI